MSFRNWLKVVIVIAVAAFMLPGALPAHAATAAIGQFYAGCGNFSVDVAVTGFNNDGNNVDKFRYMIIDANSKTLYQEDATRPVGTTTGSLVVNLPYMFGSPTKNPVTFAVIEVDGNGNAGNWMQSASYMAPCLPVSGTANRSGIFAPPKNVVGVIVAATPLYQGPGVGQLSLSAHVGATHTVVYRTADSAWVAIFVGGNDLVWIPSGAINVNLAQLALQPTRIDGSNPGIPGGGSVSAPSVAAPAPTGQTALVLTDLRMHSTPAFGADNVIDVIPGETIVSVLGVSADQVFVQVSYNGKTGWVSATFVRLGVASSGGAVASATGVTGVTLADLRLHSAPTFDLANVVSVVPFGTVVPVLGRSADNQLLKVNYNGVNGWVSSGFVRIVGSRLSALPVVQ